MTTSVLIAAAGAAWVGTSLKGLAFALRIFGRAL
jgi:hypothetical protein